MEAEYIARINRVIDYVQDNLSGDLSLGTLAKVACFSPHHFHRLFTSLTGETLGQFVRRVRLERAAAHLCRDPDRPVTEVAMDAGFSSPAAFSRAFRDHFDMSASEWRASESKNGKAMRKPGNAVGQLESYYESGAWAPKWRLIMKDSTLKNISVELRELPERTVAYLRHTGPYSGNAELFGQLFGKLAQWAGSRGLMGPSTQFLSLYHDDPSVTDHNKLRVMCCCVVPPDTEVSGEFGKSTVSGGMYGVGRFEIDAKEYGQAWDAIYGTWLPKSGFQPDDRPAVEIYLNNPQTHPEHKHIVEICVPVKPMS